MRKIISEEYIKSILFLLKWLIMSLVAGILTPGLLFLMRLFLSTASGVWYSLAIPQPLIAVGGAVIAGGILYRISPEARGEGIPSYINAVKLRHGKLDGKVTLFKVLAACATLGTFGNGGITGPVGRASAGIMSSIFRRFPGKEDSLSETRMAAIAGMAAAVGVIFHCPVGGGIFAVEIIQKAEMKYSDLFPAIMASCTAVLTGRFLGIESFYSFSVPDQFMHHSAVAGILLVALVSGLFGKLFNHFYGWLVVMFGRNRNRYILLKVVIGSTIASLLVWFINPDLMGTGTRFWDYLFAPDIQGFYGRIPHNIPFLPVIIILIFIKMAGNCLTVSCGMSAGFTSPVLLIGMMIGIAFTVIFGVPFGSPEYAAYLAAGMAGMLASTMNVPVAAGVMCIELFGLHCAFPAGIAAIIGFQINRHDTIYSYTAAQISEKIPESKKGNSQSPDIG